MVIYGRRNSDNISTLVYYQEVRQWVEGTFQIRVGSLPYDIVHNKGYAQGNEINILLSFHSTSSKHLSRSQHICCGIRKLRIVQGDIASHDSVRAIVAGYVSYTFIHFKQNVAVVFDVYPKDGTEENINTAKRLRRYGSPQCNKLIFEEPAIKKMAQEKL